MRNSPRPDGEVRVQHIQQAVRERLDAKGWQLWGGRSPDHGAYTSAEVVDQLVWETMAVLGYWEFVDLVVPDAEAGDD